jgi:ribonuclease HI
VIQIWTDGSVLVNPGGPGGWAFVAEREGVVVHTTSGGEPDTTNNRMELDAVIEAVRWGLGVDELIEVVSDSQYVVKGINEWRWPWKRRDWHKVKNVERWRELDGLITGKFSFRWVRGHDGAEFNEIADRLAGEAARAVYVPDDEPEFDADEDHLAELAAGWVL